MKPKPRSGGLLIPFRVLFSNPLLHRRGLSKGWDSLVDY